MVTFVSTISSVNLTLPITGKYWIYADWQKNDAWKNQILVSLQRKLLAKEPTIPSDHLRLFAQQLVQENGGLDPLSITGDYGHAYGLGQWYSASARAMRDTYAVRNKDGSFNWQLELERQMNVLAGGMIDRYHQYNGDIQKAIAAHNGPSRIAGGANDSCRPVRGRGISCYFRDEVSKLTEKFTLVSL